MGLYDYCALVPVVENAGGIMTDWNGNRLTLQNHLQGISKGRVVACTNPQLHREAITLLQQETKSSKRKESASMLIIGIAIGMTMGMILSSSRRRVR